MVVATIHIKPETSIESSELIGDAGAQFVSIRISGSSLFLSDAEQARKLVLAACKAVYVLEQRDNAASSEALTEDAAGFFAAMAAAR